jgi:hypothetical protein
VKALVARSALSLLGRTRSKRLQSADFAGANHVKRLSGSNPEAARRPYISAQLGKWLLQVSNLAWIGVGLWAAGGCNLGAEDGEPPAAAPADGATHGPADASAEPEWTRCPASAVGPDEGLHAAALAALVPASPTLSGPCAFGGCHNEATAKAHLNLSPSTADLRALLVGIPACEVPSWPLVDGRGGDEALTRSWLWQKLTAPAAIDGTLLGQASWGEASSCAAQAGAATAFGARMPQGSGPDLLSDERLRAVQRWICIGAPAPRTLP